MGGDGLDQTEVAEVEPKRQKSVGCQKKPHNVHECHKQINAQLNKLNTTPSKSPQCQIQINPPPLYSNVHNYIGEKPNTP